MLWALAALLAALGSPTAVATPRGAATARRLGDEEDIEYPVPEGFLVGAALSACQAEGAWDQYGKAPSVLDRLVHTEAAGFPDTADVAADHYRRYSEDLALAKQMELKSVRFSISWARVLPTGDAANPNPEGVQFYHDYIDEVIRNGLEPVVTMAHFDQPFTLENRTGGWSHPDMIDKFVDYADFLFATYGNKVRKWITLNEPNNYCVYFPVVMARAGLAPADNLGPYRCMHHMNLAHLRAYRLYQDKYRAAQQGLVGASLLVWPATPASPRLRDVLAADAFLQLFSGTSMHPLVFGDYSPVTRRLVDSRTAELGLNASRLPAFSAADRAELAKGALDFIALNVYNGYTVAYRDDPADGSEMPRLLKSIEDDLPFVKFVGGGEYDETGSDYMVMHDAVLWTWNSYHVPIIIGENGFADVGSLGVNDTIRAHFHSTNIRSLLRAMEEYGIQVMGYFAWSLVDLFEFTAGYSRNFGLVHVDYESGSLNRTLKQSAAFFQRVGRTGRVPHVPAPAPPPPPPSSSGRPAALPGAPTLTLALPAALVLLACAPRLCASLL